MNNRDFKEKLQNHTKNFFSCFEDEPRDVFEVAENEQNISFIKDFVSGDEFGLKIVNPGEQLGFLKIDNCYFEKSKDFTGERCDCLLFSDKEILFVELKLNITRKRRTTENLKEGRKQLANTISYFHSNFESNFDSFERFAIMVIPKPFYPRSQSRLSKIRKEFYDKNNGVDYIEKSEFTFIR